MGYNIPADHGSSAPASRLPDEAKPMPPSTEPKFFDTLKAKQLADLAPKVNALRKEKQEINEHNTALLREALREAGGGRWSAGLEDALISITTNATRIRRLLEPFDTAL